METNERDSVAAMARRDWAHADVMARRAGHDMALATTPEDFARAKRRQDRWSAKAREAAAEREDAQG